MNPNIIPRINLIINIFTNNIKGAFSAIKIGIISSLVARYTEKSVPKDKSKSKDKSKPKYSIQINLKDLINQDIQEKSKLSPDKRYADIETKRRTKNKANNKFKYNKPFRFNMNDDY